MSTEQFKMYAWTAGLKIYPNKSQTRYFTLKKSFTMSKSWTRLLTCLITAAVGWGHLAIVISLQKNPSFYEFKFKSKILENINYP